MRRDVVTWVGAVGACSATQHALPSRAKVLGILDCSTSGKSLSISVIQGAAAAFDTSRQASWEAQPQAGVRWSACCPPWPEPYSCACLGPPCTRWLVFPRAHGLKGHCLPAAALPQCARHHGHRHRSARRRWCPLPSSPFQHPAHPQSTHSIERHGISAAHRGPRALALSKGKPPRPQLPSAAVAGGGG